jgi:hypothetical protein
MAINTAKGIADWTRRLGLTEDEAAALVEAARDSGRPITNMVRQFVREGLRKKGKR